MVIRDDELHSETITLDTSFTRQDLTLVSQNVGTYIRKPQGAEMEIVTTYL